MTDADPIDANRPWIDDPADAPEHMNWLATFFNPFGETSRVHFTRALTVLFFLTAPFGVMLMSGGFMPAFLIVTGLSLLSFIAHMRRLASAKRTMALASLVLLPAAASLAVFTAAATMNVPEANRILAQHQADLADPEAARARRAAEREAERARLAEAGEEEKQRGRQRGGSAEASGPGWSDGHFSPAAFVMAKAGGPAGLAWGVVGLGVFIWTLLWVARLPNGGGTIRERLETVGDAGRYDMG